MGAPKKTLASDLEACLKRRYDNEVPQANILARLFNMRCDEKDAITEKKCRLGSTASRNPQVPN